MKTAILHGHLVDPANNINRVTDLFIADGNVAGVGHPPEGFRADKTLYAKNRLIIPGIIDLQARLREPGHEHKANIASETRAALRNGITALCSPPDTQPITDSPAIAETIQRRAKRAGHVRVWPIGALTQGLKGQQLSEMHALKEAGCIALSNALSPILNLQTALNALQYAATFDIKVFLHPAEPSLSQHGLVHQGPVSTRLGLKGIPVCAETIAIAQYLELIEASGVQAHFGQISTARGIEMIEHAKQRGLPITFDVAIHQLFLIDTDMLDFNSQCQVIPPFRSQNDRNALRLAVKYGQLDAICSDHQPHDLDAKQAPLGETEPGISSLDTLLPLSLRLAEEEDIPLDKVIRLLTCNPAKILNQTYGHLSQGACADLSIIDPKHIWNLSADTMLSQGKNSPFIGWEFSGKVTHTLCAGHIVYKAAN